MSDTQLATVQQELAATPKVEAQPEAVDPEMPPSAGMGYYLFRFLHSPNGKAASDKVAEMLGTFSAGQANAHRLQVLNALARYALLAGILGAAIVLQLRGKLDSAIIGLLSLVTGYIFGRQKAE